MPEWIAERGIGETRLVRIEDGEIVEARILLEGAAPTGSTLEARLVSVGSGGRNAVARAVDGTEYLLPTRPPGVSEGASLFVEVTREAIPGIEPWKRPLARAADGPAREFSLDARDANSGELDAVGWADLMEQATSGAVGFPGGSLSLHLTPAMVLIDVDGHLPPGELAVAGAAAAGRAIRRLGIGGSIGIDLPTASGKAARQAAADALDQAMGDARFERTAVNGFGFVQLVRPRRHPSLLELSADRATFAARAAMRLAEGGVGQARLVAHPAVIAVVESSGSGGDWGAKVARMRGGALALRADPGLAISVFHVE